MKILAIAHHMCRPDMASGDQRFFRVLKLLTEFAEVDFLIPEHRPKTGDQKRYWNELDKFGIKFVHPTAWNCVEDLCVSKDYDWVLVEFWHQAERLLPIFDKMRARNSSPFLVVDSVDVHFLRELGEFDLRGGLPTRELDEINDRKRRELNVYENADLIFVVSDEDRECLRREGCRTKTVFVPNIIDATKRISKLRALEILFVGGFKHQPNVDAITWFVTDVFPIVQKAIPNVHLVIAGSHPPKDILDLQSLEGITVTGFVQDLEPFVDRAAVAIAPLRYGAGMKGKVTNALASGIPVVTTAIGAQGLPLVDGLHCRIADAPESFATAVIETVTEQGKYAKIAAEGQLLVKAICGPSAVKRVLETELVELSTTAKSGSTKPNYVKRAMAYVRLNSCHVKSRLRSKVSRLYRSRK